MKTIQEIRSEIERLSEDRAVLLQRLSAGRDVVLAAELKELDERIARLWDEHREARVRLRFGDRNESIQVSSPFRSACPEKPKICAISARTW